MKRILNTEDFVSEIATRAKFTKADVRIILKTIIDVLTDAVLENSILKIRSLGKLYTQKIPPRKGIKGIQLPESTRVIFKLSENIRFADKRYYSED